MNTGGIEAHSIEIRRVTSQRSEHPHMYGKTFKKATTWLYGNDANRFHVQG